MTFAFAHGLEAAHAPVPRTPAEHQVFSLLYSPLVRFDCEARPRPAIAVGWEPREEGRAWILRLDPEARFWDGSPLTAADVAAGLLTTGAKGETTIPDIVQLGVLDERTISIRFDRRYPDIPLVLGAPELAVALPREGMAWPLGAGPYRPQLPERPAGTRDAEERIATIPADGNRPRLSFHAAPGADGRDLIDRGADLLLTRDAAVLEYVRLRPELITAPLPWDLTYALLAPTRVRALSRNAPQVVRLPGGLLERLARDAVRSSARPHESPAWWTEGEACREARARLREHPAPPPTAAYRGSVARRVVYRQGDETAAQLAGRIVALATGSGPGRAFAEELAAAVPALSAAGVKLSAVALPDSSFDSQLREGAAFLFVLSLPLSVFDRCRALEEMGRRAPWLSLGALDPAEVILPLIDTRPYLVAREGAPSIRVDWGGVLRFEPPSAAPTEDR